MQRLSLLALGNLGFCSENRRILSQSESLHELLLRLTVTPVPRVNKAAARALAILGISNLHYASDFYSKVYIHDLDIIRENYNYNFVVLNSGENENLQRAVKRKPVGKQGLRILSMDGGGMKGLATVQMLKQIEQGTGKRIHEMFDLICGTSTGGMLAVALGIKQMTLEQCEDIYKELGKKSGMWNILFLLC